MSLFNFNEAFAPKMEADKNKNEMSSRSLQIKTRIRFENKMKKQAIQSVIESLPTEGVSIHIVSNGSFDYFNIITRILEFKDRPADEFYFSTWTMSHQNVIDILELYDRGSFKNVHALTGEYFRTREAAVYHILYHGIKERGQKLFSNKNHAKVTLLKIDDDYYVVEGSANFTANPRIEQFILSNSKELFNFHKEWMDELFKHTKNGI